MSFSPKQTLCPNVLQQALTSVCAWSKLLAHGYEAFHWCPLGVLKGVRWMANPTRWIHDSLTGYAFQKKVYPPLNYIMLCQPNWFWKVYRYRTIISFAFSVLRSQATFPGSTSVPSFAPLRNFQPFHHRPPGDSSKFSGSTGTSFSTRQGQETGPSQEKLDCGAIKVAVGSNMCMCKNPTL